MWSYYGTKKRIAKYYPKPLYDTIIEPFCGAAQYSLFGDNWKKKVILIDKYKTIIDLWKWLIQAKKCDILNLPILKMNESVDDYTQLCSEEKSLIGFYINSGSASPKKTAKKFNGWTENKKKDIANNLYKISHWKAFHNEYLNIPNKPSTWFIDPPYQFGGQWYRESNKTIDFNNLADWCKSREGQIIVCENNKADWLPFKNLVEMNGQKHKTMEVIWTKGC